MLSTLLDGVGNITNAVDSVLKFESSDAKFTRIKRKFDALECREKDIREELSAESLSLKKPRNEVENWLRDVGNIKPKVRLIEQEVEERKGKWLPSLQLHINLDRLTSEIEEVYHRCQFPRGLTFGKQENRGITFPTTKLVGQMFKENKNFIRQCLRDDNVLSIGVYGMGGVGKTTLVTHINNELLSDSAVSSVLWVTVSQDFNVYKLQESIANALGLSLSEEDEKERAAKLSGELQIKKFVLILDDVWEDIDLDEVGVSLRVDGCKMILTTRSFDVCQKMNCQKVVRVTPLSWDEPWELFTRELGDYVELNPMIEEVARCLVKECAGLPLGIIRMARSMRKVDDMFEWKNAFESMRQSKIERDEDMEKVFRVLSSYEMLKDPKVQQCFLDCSLYPEDCKIPRDLLIEQFIDERLIDGMKNRQAEIYRGETIVNKLVNACLLETYEDCGRRYVKMHDLVRDMALQITNSSPRFLVSAGLGLKEIPDEDEWDEDLVKVSLMGNSFSEIRVVISSPNCPKISTLMLSLNKELKFISDNFFQYMVGLNVLDLSYTKIDFLPASIYALVNLSALLLKGCQSLQKILSLANLKALRRLDLNNSGIKELPPGLEVLSKLKYLDLSTQTLEIRPGDLANLTSLQFLVLGWHSSGNSRVRGEELTQLRWLETLRINLYSINDLNTYVKSLDERELISYIIQVGFYEDSFWKVKEYTTIVDDNDWKKREYTKVVFIRKEEIRENAAWDKPLLLPQGIQFLCIDSCNMGKSLSETASLDSLTNLRTCHILNSFGIENLLASPPSPSPLLQTLEELKIKNLDNFQGFISDDLDSSSLSPPHGSFSSLKEIYISDCPRITKLFTTTSISLFQNLEKLKLVNLENFRGFISDDLDLSSLAPDGSFSSLKEIYIVDCPRITKLFTTSSISLFPNLEKLKLENLKDFRGLINEDLDSSSLAPHGSYSSLKEVYISRCPSIKKLFTNATILVFKNLEKIDVDRCYQMEEIFGVSSDGNIEEKIRKRLPKLKTLMLRFLRE